MNSFIKFSAVITACATFLFCTHTETAFAADGDSPQLAPMMTPAPLELGRGVNVLGYDPIWNNFEQRRFKAEYFSKIKEAGFDHLRLNIHPFRHQLGADEGYRMKDEWYKTLDWIVDNALRNDLKIILDLHEYNAMSEDPEGNRERFLSFWRQMSDKFASYSNRVVFELLNEPHNKLDAKLWNVYAKDVLAVIREKNPERPVIIGDGVETIEIFDEESPWKRKEIKDYTIKDIRVKIFEGGKLIYDRPSVKEVHEYCAEQLETIWEETLRFENPQTYYVDLSQKLYDLKHKMIDGYRK